MLFNLTHFFLIDVLFKSTHISSNNFSAFFSVSFIPLSKFIIDRSSSFLVLSLVYLYSVLNLNILLFFINVSISILLIYDMFIITYKYYNFKYKKINFYLQIGKNL